MRKQTRKALFGWLGILFLAQFLLHGLYITDTWDKDFGTKSGGVITNQLDPSQIIAELFGFREFLAGILWVRGDTFFDQGNYDAVLPIIRLCTILDPHQIDIYSTGMWHIAYNFTDQDQRSDRRYIPIALALGKEGTQQNPNTYELFFETGWIWFNKIDDNYDKAVDWFEQATQRKDMQEARRNLLAHAYERAGRVDKALDTYFQLLKQATDNYNAAPNAIGDRQVMETDADNTDNTILRMVQRGWLAKERGDYAAGDYDTKPPYDVGFSVRVSVEDSKVLRFQGTYNVQPVGTRIRVVLRDDQLFDPDGRRIDEPAEMKWDFAKDVNLDPPKDETFMEDQLFVRNRRFDKRIDLSKDPTMYPFSHKVQRYVLEFFYDPHSAPEHIQDKFGWDGTGMTDKHYMNDQVRPGERVLYAKFYLTRDQILRRGEWALGKKVPVIESIGYNDKAATSVDDRVISLSTPLRGASK